MSFHFNFNLFHLSVHSSAHLLSLSLSLLFVFVWVGGVLLLFGWLGLLLFFDCFAIRFLEFEWLVCRQFFDALIFPHIDVQRDSLTLIYIYIYLVICYV